MPFVRSTWVDGSEPGITAAQLNRVEVGVEDAHAGDLDLLSVGTGVLADNAVSDVKLRDSAALSVVGRAGNSVGDPADIAAVTDGHVLRLAGTALGFGTVATAGIADTAVTNVKIASGVDAAKLTTGTLPIARIDDLAVTEAKIGPGAVTEAKLGAGAVTTARLQTATDASTGVTNAKLRWGAARTVLGRAGNTTGAMGAITATDGAAGVLREVGGVLGFGTVATAGIGDLQVTNAKLAASGLDAGKLTVGTLPIARVADGAVTSAKLRNSAALSVIGNAGSTANVPNDVSAAAASGAVLRESGSAIGFGTVATAGIANGAITNEKLRNSAARSVIGRFGGTAGVPDDIEAVNDHEVLRRSGSDLAFGTVATAGLADLAVATGKLAGAAVTPAKTSFMGTFGATAGIYAGHNSHPARWPTDWSGQQTDFDTTYTVTHNLGTTDYAVMVQAFGGASPAVERNENTFVIDSGAVSFMFILIRY